MCCVSFVGKKVLRRWKHLRDAFAKPTKKAKECITSGAKATRTKKNTRTSITTSCRRKEKVLSHAQLPQKRKKLDDLDLKIMKVLEPEKPNAPMSFFRSLLPHTESYDND
nr:unnamed protein product [Callosobruchus analis]